MFRTLSLALLAVSLGACATASKSDTALLLQNVAQSATPTKCVAETYCVTTATRIGNKRASDRMCSCTPPAALRGIPVGR
jgi:hypothetical protein